MAESWLAAAILVAIGALALGILFLIVGKSRLRRTGAPTNTQLQQTPPAIIRSSYDDRP